MCETAAKHYIAFLSAFILSGVNKSEKKVAGKVSLMPHCVLLHTDMLAGQILLWLFSDAFTQHELCILHIYILHLCILHILYMYFTYVYMLFPVKS